MHVDAQRIYVRQRVVQHQARYTLTEEKIRAISILTLRMVIVTANVNPIDKSTDLTAFSLTEQLQSLIGGLYITILTIIFLVQDC